jgi:hypothetical protein
MYPLFFLYVSPILSNFETTLHVIQNFLLASNFILFHLSMDSKDILRILSVGIL